MEFIAILSATLFVLMMAVAYFSSTSKKPPEDHNDHPAQKDFSMVTNKDHSE